jgi:hypothetical protein
MSVVGALIELRKPLKLATTVLCSAKHATLSLILPLKATIMNIVKDLPSDSGILKDVKRAIHDNMAPR